MTLLTGSPDTDSSPAALTGTYRRALQPARGPRNKTSRPPDAPCQRCGGLMVLSYTAALEWDVTGELMTLWYCVNCGDCLDTCILVNRGKASVSARPHTRPRTGRQHLGRPPGVRTGTTL
jgi:hypothetical protein